VSQEDGLLWEGRKSTRSERNSTLSREERLLCVCWLVESTAVKGSAADVPGSAG
jgi:hypothetical protein